MKAILEELKEYYTTRIDNWFKTIDHNNKNNESFVPTPTAHDDNLTRVVTEEDNSSIEDDSIIPSKRLQIILIKKEIRKNKNALIII